MNIAEGANRYNILHPEKYKGPNKQLLYIAKEKSSAACRAASVALNMAKNSVNQEGIGRAGDMSIEFIDKNTGNALFVAKKPKVKGAAAALAEFCLQVRMSSDDRYQSN